MFKAEIDIDNFKLHIKNAFGSVLLSPEISEKENMVFHIPKNYTRVAGPCRWELLMDGHMIKQGKFDIATNAPKATYIESYFGPRSVTAGYNDYSMLTVAPTDAFDNPLDDGTKVTVKYQFQDNIDCLLYTSPSPRDGLLSRMPSSA